MLNCLLFQLISIQHITSKTLTGTKIAHTCNMCNTKACVICTDVVWLGSPAAIELSVLGANEALSKLTVWDIIKKYIQQTQNSPRGSDNSP